MADTNKIIEFELIDDFDESESPRSLKGSVEFYDFGIYLKFDGYGQADAMPGTGWPVLIEYYNGELRVVTWTDINNEEPAFHNMEGAREELYRE